MSRTLPLLPLALLLLAAPLHAQDYESRGESRMIESHNGYTLEVRSRGRVEFNDEGDWVTELGPGAYLVVREDTRSRDQRLEFEPEGNGIRVEYRVDGRERPLDAAGREWARRVLRQATRESGLGADTRVARIRRRSGVAGVLADMSDLRTDTGRRLYYLALLRSGPMSEADYARVMDDVGTRMQSGTEKRLVLVDAAGRVPEGRPLAALLRAAGRIESDTETRLVLVQVAERHALSDPAARDAFFRAVDGLGSNTERRLVLVQVLERTRLDDPAMRGAFFRAVDGIGSDTERRLVLIEAMSRNRSQPVVIGVLNSAAEIGSDTEKRLVLTSVPSSLRNDSRVVDAYRRVVERIGSDTERRLALTWLLNGGR